MARYEHLPIYKAAYDLALHMEKIVRNFSRYHKYTLGAELRDSSRNILKRIIAANNTGDTGERIRILEELRGEAEWFKVLARLCHESGGFANTKAYLHVSEQAVKIAKQNEGWLRQSGKKPGRRRRAEKGEPEKGPNPEA